MAITLKKKGTTGETTVVLGPTKSDLDALKALGLTSEPTEHKPKTTQAFQDGARVVITNDLWTWIEFWKAGDVGRVVDSYPPPLNSGSEDPEQFRLYKIRLESPRDINHVVVAMRGWELALA